MPCDFNAIFGKLIAAEALFIACVASLLVAAALNSSIFLVGGSPAAVLLALVTAGVALGLLIALLVEANACGNANCLGARGRFTQPLAVLIAGMTILTVGLVAVLAGSAVPVLGSIGIIAMMVGILGQLKFWPDLAGGLDAWVRCELTVPPPAAVVATVGAFVAAAVIVIFGVVAIFDAFGAGILSYGGKPI